MSRRLAPFLLLAIAACGLAAAPPNDFRFSILGDRTGNVVPGVYEQVWSEVDRLRPDFVINVGDTIQGVSDAIAEAQWKQVKSLLEPYKRYPLYLVAGNHDIWSDFSRKVFQRETGRPAFYSFDHQDAHFTVLDNSGAPELSTEQLRFLEEDLKRNRERHPKFVFFHQPFWLVFLKLQSGDFPLHQIAKEYGVDYVVSGHGHQLVRMRREGVLYMEVGSSGAPISPAFEQGRFYQHISVQVKGPQARFTLKELNAPFGEGRSLDAEEWDKLAK
jgi:predicted phosphodiesterase